jgi:hypothetical protein
VVVVLMVLHHGEKNFIATTDRAAPAERRRDAPTAQAI